MIAAQCGTSSDRVHIALGIYKLADHNRLQKHWHHRVHLRIARSASRPTPVDSSGVGEVPDPARAPARTSAQLFVKHAGVTHTVVVPTESFAAILLAIELKIGVRMNTARLLLGGADTRDTCIASKLLQQLLASQHNNAPLTLSLLGDVVGGNPPPKRAQRKTTGATPVLHTVCI